MNIALFHIDGRLPNLALMKLSAWHRSNGDDVRLYRGVAQLRMGDPVPDRVYASTIFQYDRSRRLAGTIREQWPDARIYGTGLPDTMGHTVETELGVGQFEHYDYSIYPHYRHSIGFTQRGCRLQCGFCVVPAKEGRPVSTATLSDLMRPDGDGGIVLLDNDFFGQPPNQWKARVGEMVEMGCRVSLCQGINVRLITDETASAMASLDYRDITLKSRVLQTAWDNIGQERVFFRGLEKLNAAGIPSKHVAVYMLIGYDPAETMGDVMYRWHRLRDAGCLPYPMPYRRKDASLTLFQHWALTARYKDPSFRYEDYYHRHVGRELDTTTPTLDLLQSGASKIRRRVRDTRQGALV